jgi:hypothetical protein
LDEVQFRGQTPDEVVQLVVRHVLERIALDLQFLGHQRGDHPQVLVRTLFAHLADNVGTVLLPIAGVILGIGRV